MNNSVIITLSNDYANLLSLVIEEYENDNCVEIEVLKNRLSPNQSEFIFYSPNEKFMFTLGTQYGKLIERCKEIV